MKIPVELPIWRSTVDPSSANNPTRSGDRREAPLSASQPQTGEKARSAAPYMAIKTDTQYCTRSCSTWLRLCRANGITGTITPYKNISYEESAYAIMRWSSTRQNSLFFGVLTVNTAKATVPTIKPSELLNFNMAGGFAPCCVRIASHFGRAIMPIWCLTTSVT